MIPISLLERFKGAIVGLAVGDALGAATEFKLPSMFTPLTGYRGDSLHEIPAGYWTDDTSMMLCTAASLIETGSFDLVDQANRFLNWLDTGYMSSTGECFDIGGATSTALNTFRLTSNPLAGSTHEHSAGNGGLMRQVPVVLYAFPNVLEAVKLSEQHTAITHRATECLDAAAVFAVVLCGLLDARSREEIVTAEYVAAVLGQDRILSPKVAAVISGSWREKTVDTVRPTGYVVDSLEASLWCFMTSESFDEAVLKAANLGHDADTVAAITGQMAGAFWGYVSIREDLRDGLKDEVHIAQMAEMLFELNARRER